MPGDVLSMEGLAVTLGATTDSLKDVLTVPYTGRYKLVVAGQEIGWQAVCCQWVMDDCRRLRATDNMAGIEVYRPDRCDHCMSRI